MKKTAYLLVALALLVAAPVFAQGPFTDVPTDHWAYDAINQLQKDGLLIGYPDGTFGGKRTLTRYEFAVALARLVEAIPGLVTQTPAGTAGVTQDQLNAAIAGVEAKIPNISNLATKADVDALRKLIDEFRDEIAALGVDVDALKRDVAALCARVEAIEAELRRVRFTGDANAFAIATNSSGARQIAVDLDNRLLALPPATAGAPVEQDTLIRSISFVKDFDLNVVGRVTDRTTANATINYGNYLNYVGFVDDYIDGTRPRSKAGTAAFNGSTVKNSLSDTFFPYYLYIESALGKGAVQVGRFPIQFTPYTLKKIDVDSYTNILKTEDGNYPMDGGKLAWNFGFVDLTLFAAKNDTNDFLVNGLTGQPNNGIYSTQTNAAASTIAGFNGPLGAPGVLHQIANGHALGGLTQVTQTAGVRAVAGIPWGGTIGGTFYQGWNENAFYGLVPGNAGAYDQARVFGGDISLALPVLSGINFAGSWTQCDTLAIDGTGFTNVDYLNTAWDGRFSGTFGRFGVGVGYKDIGRNFAAAGFWDKIGRWTNPTDIKGPYADITVPIMDNLKIAINGEYLEVKDNMYGAAPAGGFWGAKGDKLWKAEGAIKWGFTKNNTLDLSGQWVSFNPDQDGVSSDDATEVYLTVGLAHQFSATTGLKVGYQFVNYDDGEFSSGPYPADYRGGLGVVQFGVSF